MKTQLEIGNLSDVGKVRSANEDYFGSYKGKYGTLVIVCDGMGGHKGGAMASRLSVDTIKEHFESLEPGLNLKDELRSALVKADGKLKDVSLTYEELKEMGSTAVILLIKADQAFTAHIGDSRIYMVRNNQIHQLTKDHSLIQQMIDANIVTAEAAKDHPKKNIITRSLGADGSSEPEVAEPFQIFRHDKFILCSDGLTGYVDESEILEVVSKNTIQQSCKILVDLANERGGKDNITVQIVSVQKGKRLPGNSFIKNKKYQLYASIAVFIAVLILFLNSFGLLPWKFLYHGKTSKAGKITIQKKSEQQGSKNKGFSKSSDQDKIQPEMKSDEFQDEASPVKPKTEKQEKTQEKK